jgi:hypothetical protein
VFKECEAVYPGRHLPTSHYMYFYQIFLKVLKEIGGVGDVWRGYTSYTKQEKSLHNFVGQSDSKISLDKFRSG